MANNRLTRGTALVGGLNSTNSLTVGASGVAIKKIAAGTVAIDFDSTPAQGSDSETVTVTGVAVGDIVIVSPRSNPAAGVAYEANARVTTDNTIQVRMVNASSGTVDPAEVTFDYLWFDLT